MLHFIKAVCYSLTFLFFPLSFFYCGAIYAEDAGAYRKHIREIIEKEKEVIASIDHINFELNYARKEVKKLEKEINDGKEKIKKVEIKKNSIENEIKSAKSYISSRLISFYKYDNLKTLNFLCSFKSVYDFLNTTFFVKKIIDYDNSLLYSLEQKYSEFEKIISDLDIRIDNEKKLRKKLSEDIESISKKKELKKKMLYEISKKKSLQIAAFAALQKTAEELDEKIYNMPSEPEKKQDGEKNFYDYKGLLKMPVKGEIVLKYGAYKDKNLDVSAYSNGINIKTNIGEPIRAVFDGKIIFARWLKHYGNILIADHGENYYTVYANIQDIFKKEGDEVLEGEVIATAGDTGSFKDCELHFEIRHHGKSLNPLLWLNNG